MWFRNTKPAGGLLEEHVKRLWDLASRLTQLEDRLDGKLDDLAKRYRRAEQTEHRLEKKIADADCVECDDSPGADHPAILALKRRQQGAPPSRPNNAAG